MRSEGTIGVPKEGGGYTSVKYGCKHFDEPGEYGINGGRISKLTLKQGSREVYNYDRGLDIPPQTKEAEAALAILMKDYN